MNILSEFINETSARDYVFKNVISLFNNKPINILEIGCLRDLNSRKGDGWSSLHWSHYVQSFGGQFTTVDINQNSINLCADIINSIFSGNFKFLCGNGNDYINSEYDFIYLDGGDDPSETLSQYEKCVENNVKFILIDDFHTKGKFVNEKFLNKTLFSFSNGHKMALYGIDVENKIIEVEVK